MNGKHSPTILVVDNNEGVCALLEMALRQKGLTVITANSGTKAIELFGQHDIHALLTDVNMPGMGGPETAEALQILQPGLPCFFMTGSSDVTKDELPEAIELFQKPFPKLEATAQKIADFMRASLGQQPPEKNDCQLVREDK